jgi:hypothetical protein
MDAMARQTGAAAQHRVKIKCVPEIDAKL